MCFGNRSHRCLNRWGRRSALVKKHMKVDKVAAMKLDMVADMGVDKVDKVRWGPGSGVRWVRGPEVGGFGGSGGPGGRP